MSDLFDRATSVFRDFNTAGDSLSGAYEPTKAATRALFAVLTVWAEGWVTDIVNAPTGDEADGERYIVGTSPSGLFGPYANHVAIKIDDQWQFSRPPEGAQDLLNRADGRLWQFSGGVWAHTSASTLGLGTAADHDASDFALSTRTITAGSGLSGGGSLTGNVTLSANVGSTNITDATTIGKALITAASAASALSTIGGVGISRRVIAGSGMSGGGALSADVTLNANVTSVAGRTGAITLSTSDISGLGSIATHSTSDFLSSSYATNISTNTANIATNTAAIAAINSSIAKSVSYIGRANAKIAILGDSITAQNTSTNNQSLQARGYMAQAAALSMQRFYFDSTMNFGVSGNTTTDVIARLPAVIAAAPSRVFLLIGTNDISGGSSAATIFANIQIICDTLNDAGIPVDICPITPRTYNMTATKRAYLNQLNHLILNEVGNRNSLFYNVVPANIPLIDRNSPTGDPITGAFFPESDGKFLHPQDYGATLMGQVISAYYNILFPAQPVPVNNQADLYDATYNPYGAINPNPFVTGTGGTAGTGITGSVATYYTIERYGSGTTFTATASKGTDPSPQGGVTQIISLGASGTGIDGETIRMKQTHFDFNFSAFSAGDKFVFEADVEQSGLTNVKNIAVLFNSGTTSSWYGLSPSGVTGDRTVASCRRLIRSQTFTLSSPAEVIDVFLSIQADCSGTAPSGTVTVRSFVVRKVP